MKPKLIQSFFGSMKILLVSSHSQLLLTHDSFFTKPMPSFPAWTFYVRIISIANVHIFSIMAEVKTLQKTIKSV